MGLLNRTRPFGTQKTVLGTRELIINGRKCAWATKYMNFNNCLR